MMTMPQSPPEQTVIGAAVSQCIEIGDSSTLADPQVVESLVKGKR